MINQGHQLSGNERQTDRQATLSGQ